MNTRRTILSGIFLASAVPAAGLALRPGGSGDEVLACGPACGEETLHTVSRVATVADSTVAEPGQPAAPFMQRCPICGRGLGAEPVAASTL